MNAVLLTTPRLRLRPITDADFARLHALHTDPLVVASLYNGAPPPPDDTHARLDGFLRDWAEHGFGYFAVFTKDAGPHDETAFLGRRGLRYLPGSTDLELGACFHGWASGFGFAPEAGRAVLAFAFRNLAADRVLTVVRPENHRSLRSVAKMGFRPIADRFCYGRWMKCFEVTPTALAAAASLPLSPQTLPRQGGLPE